MSDLIYRHKAIKTITSHNGVVDKSVAKRLLLQMKSAQPEPMCINFNEPIKVKLTDWGKPIGDGRPLADSEVIPRLQDIKRQIGGSYAIERAIEVLEGLQSTQPEIIRCKDCKWKQGSECVRFAEVRPFPDDYCSRAERRGEGE